MSVARTRTYRNWISSKVTFEKFNSNWKWVLQSPNSVKCSAAADTAKLCGNTPTALRRRTLEGFLAAGWRPVGGAEGYFRLCIIAHTVREVQLSFRRTSAIASPQLVYIAADRRCCGGWWGLYTEWLREYTIYIYIYIWSVNNHDVESLNTQLQESLARRAKYSTVPIEMFMCTTSARVMKMTLPLSIATDVSRLLHAIFRPIVTIRLISWCVETVNDAIDTVMQTVFVDSLYGY